MNIHKVKTVLTVSNVENSVCVCTQDYIIRGNSCAFSFIDWVCMCHETESHLNVESPIGYVLSQEFLSLTADGLGLCLSNSLVSVSQKVSLKKFPILFIIFVISTDSLIFPSLIHVFQMVNFRIDLDCNI